MIDRYFSRCVLGFIALALHYHVCFGKMVGYVGPACVVVDDLLYMHGFYIRRLNSDEIEAFNKYQSALDVYRQLNNALAKGVASVSTNSSLFESPEIPAFCNGLDDTLEVVLDGCTVRNNAVYIADKLIRFLSLAEQEKINLMMKSASSPMMGGRRKRRKRATKHSPRNDNEESSLNGMQNDVAALLGHFLNVNASVADRFIPMAKMSPLLSRINHNKVWNKALANLDAHFNGNNRKPKKADAGQSSSAPAFDGVSLGKEATSAAPEDETKILKRLHNAPASEYGMVQEAQRQPAMEIPHVVFETNGEYAMPPTGRLDMNNPLLLQLLHSLASQQQSVSQIQGQAQPQQRPLEFLSTSSAAMKPGDTMTIGGTQYVAVPLSSVIPQNLQISNPPAALGLMPTEQKPQDAAASNLQASSHTNFQWMHPGRVLEGVPQFPLMEKAQQQNNGGGDLYSNSSPSQQQHSTVRFHPEHSRRKDLINSPPFSLPNEICQAHILEPFRLSRLTL